MAIFSRPVDPQISIDSTGNTTVVRCYSAGKNEDVSSILPAVGATGAGGTPEAGLKFAGSVQRTGVAYTEIDVSWNVGGTIQVSGTTEWRADSQTVQTPIEQSPDFLMKWAYNLYQIDSEGVAIPAWHAAATDADDADGLQYTWSKTHPGKGWRQIVARSKLNDYFFLPQMMSISEKTYSTRTAAAAVVRAVATIETPTVAWGVTGGSWLIVNSRIERRGSMYVCVTSYLHSPNGWDTDLYD